MKTESKRRFSIKTTSQNWLWFYACFVIIFIAIGYKFYFHPENQNKVHSLQNYNDPQAALKETHKALFILSTHLNSGIESVQYIQEYDKSKKLIFKE